MSPGLGTKKVSPTLNFEVVPPAFSPLGCQIFIAVSVTIR